MFSHNKSTVCFMWSLICFSFAQLEGVKEPVVLQVFVGNDAGRVKPHGFYQACRVTGRNTTACKEVDIEGTTVIEVSLDPSTNMTLAYVLFLRLKSSFFLVLGITPVRASRPELTLTLIAGWTVLGSWSSVMLTSRLASGWPDPRRRAHVLDWCFGSTSPVQMDQYSHYRLPHRQSCVVSHSSHISAVRNYNYMNSLC